MLLAKDQALVCPGDKLSEVDDALPGNGTHVFEGFIVSSLLGRLKYAYASLSAGPIQQQNEGETKAATTSTSKPTLSVTIEGRGIEGGEASARELSVSGICCLHTYSFGAGRVGGLPLGNLSF